MNVEEPDEETTRMVERVVGMRVGTKHINMWILQLVMKTNEMIKLAWLMKLEGVKNEVEKERS